MVRIALMRSTIHLVTADDCLTLRPVIQPVLDRGFKGTYGRRLQGVDAGRFAAGWGGGARRRRDRRVYRASSGSCSRSAASRSTSWRGEAPNRRLNSRLN